MKCERCLGEGGYTWDDSIWCPCTLCHGSGRVWMTPRRILRNIHNKLERYCMDRIFWIHKNPDKKMPREWLFKIASRVEFRLRKCLYPTHR